MTVRRQSLRHVWTLLQPYWVSDQRWAARGLLAAVVALNLGIVFINVRLNAWNAAFFDAIQAKDQHEFVHQLFWFTALAAAFIVCAVYALFLTQLLQIRWRRWLTERFLDQWLAGRVYYRLQLTGNGADNPDQRIADDLRLFVDGTLNLSIGALRSVVTVCSFVGILWALSGPLALSVAGRSIHIAGYLVWTALAYAACGTWLTNRVGKPLIALNNAQQRYEADLRFSLARFRENAEGVALYGGEGGEKRAFLTRFRSVMDNWRAIMRRQKQLTWLTSGYGQVAIIFPYLAVSPRYFSGAILLGGLTQTADAFGTLQSALSWFVDAYSQLAEWRATVDRLVGLQLAIDHVKRDQDTSHGVLFNADVRNTLSIKELNLALPDGRPLLRGGSIEFSPGEAVLISGYSGTGKSTLFRALAGIWPFGNGVVTVPQGARLLFLPQRPYLIIGTLRDNLCYPGRAEGVETAVLESVLDDCELPHLTNRLDESRNWGLELSGGEQQRLAMCRALVARPDWLLMDEGTSALDEPTEARLLRMLRARLTHTTIVSIGHRRTLEAFHDRHLELRAGAEGGTLCEVSEPAGVLSPMGRSVA